MTTSEQIDQIATAGAKAQQVLKHAVKDAENPHYKSKYANEAAVRDAARVFADNGIAVWQGPVTTDRGVEVTTLLTHTSGQWIKFDPYLVPASRLDAHGVGSATTYAKRYALAAALGIAADDDDDGNQATSGKGHKADVTPVRVAARKRVGMLPPGTVQILSTELTQWGGDVVVVDGNGVETTHKTPDRQCAELCEQISQEGVPVILDLQPIRSGKNAGKVKLTAVHRWIKPEENAAIDAEIAAKEVEVELPL